jgi:diguanylate cyclase (GGDEF)-like protein
LFGENEVKIHSHDKLFTFIESLAIQKIEANNKLLLTEVLLKARYGDYDFLSLDPEEDIVFEVGADEIVFNYVFNDLKNIDNILYSFRLKGLSDHWSEFNANQHQSFNWLPAGEYQFELKAKDTLNNIHQITPYKFIINPKWYMTTLAQFIWWFIGLIVLAYIFYEYLRWREKKHEIQKEELKKVINERTTELKAANKRLRSMAHQDGLTGLSNRLYLDKYINRLIEKGPHQSRGIMRDMDHCEQSNDTKGHMEGDKLLIKLAKCLKKVINKDHNLLARYGGEEFLVIMPNKDLDFALEKAESIRQIIEDKSKGISISTGISTSTEIYKSDQDIYHLIDKADQAMYQAKTNGRNQVCVFEES